MTTETHEKELIVVRMATRLANLTGKPVYLYRDNESELTATTSHHPDWPILETIHPVIGVYDDEN
jgi:hypothetical protein